LLLQPGADFQSRAQLGRAQSKDLTDDLLGSAALY
jgi:hypothetical protein